MFSPLFLLPRIAFRADKDYMHMQPSPRPGTVSGKAFSAFKGEKQTAERMKSLQGCAMGHKKSLRGIMLILLLSTSIFLSGCAIAAYEGYEEYEKQHQKEQPPEKPHKPTAKH